MNSSNVDEQQIKIIKDWLGSGSINLFGRPFSGKDTQAQVLSELLDAPVIGGGDIIREAKLRNINDHTDGFLIPQDQYLSLVLPYLSKSELANKPLVLSALGRWHGEEEPICNSAKESNHPIMAVINLEVSEESVIKRLAKSKELGDRTNRKDDHMDAIKTRLSEFRDKTQPVLDHYKQKNLLITVDGEQSRTQVTKSIINKLLEFAKKDRISKKAPAFNLQDQNGKYKSLSDYAGKWLVLYFYPKDNTPGCTKEACNFRDERAAIADLGNAEVVGISKDSVKSHLKFANKYKLDFTLLSDPEHKVIQSYDSWGVKKFMGKEYQGTLRNTFIINPKGQIAKSYFGVNPKDHATEIINDLKILQVNQ